VEVLICPDSFTGTLSAAQAAAAMAGGWAGVAPGDDLVLRPLSDGGPGFLDAVGAGRGGVRHPIWVTGPLGSPVEADFLMTDDGTAWIESASAAGLHLVPADRRDPTRTTSRGVGELMAAALAGGARRIVVGVGGTGTCDGGAGLLEALGAVAQPSGGLSHGGGPLAELAALDLTPALAALDGITLEVATDVDVPLLGARGAARGFAAQKGATQAQVEQLEAAMARWAGLLGRTADGRSPAVALGAGAGGGLGAALVRLGARRVPGIGTVLEAAGLADLIASADLVITGEGSFDWQSLRGKVVAGVAAAALERAVPVVVLAGRVEVSRREWISAGIAAAFPAAAEPGETPAEGVARAAARVARTWSRR
jgi:glycerate kinase